MTDLSDDGFGQSSRHTAATHNIGAPLDALSIKELDAHIKLLFAEIERLNDARQAKIASKSAADQFFKS